MADNKPFPKIKNISSIDEAMLNRLVLDPNSASKAGKPTINPSELAGVFRHTVRETSDIRNIFKIMPWLHLSREILISSIVSPGDLIQVVLSITNKMKSISPALSSQLDKVLKDFFIDEQKMESKVYEWVDEAMVMKGAHPIMIFPEASLDKMIQTVTDKSSMESVINYNGETVDGWYKPKGILALHDSTRTTDKYFSMESSNGFQENKNRDLHTIKIPIKDKIYNTNIRITDNLIAFRKPAIDELKKRMLMNTTYSSPAFEAAKAKYSKYNNEEIRQRFFKRPTRANNDRMEILQVSSIKETEGLGHPLEFHLPSEAVIPVFVPGDVTNHAWYIVITDQNGYPASYINQVDYYNDMRNYLTTSGSEADSAGDIMQMAKETISGNVKDVGYADIERLTRMHSDVIEADIINRIRNGLLGGEFEISMPDQVKRMMFARSLMNKQTTLVLVPSDYMVYMAYDYNEFGVGKSILEDGKSLFAQTAAVQTANILGAIQNAIPGKDINIELDPDDETPMETAVWMVSEALGLAYRQFPITIGSTAGLTEQLQLSAFNVNVSGNPRYPEVKTTITPRESTQVVIDPELIQQLKDDLNKLFGLTPEMVDSINQPDFATTVVNNSLLLLKRVMIGQLKTNPFLSDYIRIYTHSSGILIKRLLDVIDSHSNELPDNYKNDPITFIEDYINTIECALPKPQTENLVKQAELIEKIATSIDTILDANFKEELLAGFNDAALEEAYPVLRQSFKSMLLRKWMREHGIMRDLDIFMTDEEGSPLALLSDEMASHTDLLRKMVGNWYKKVAKYVERNKKETKSLHEAVNKANEVASGEDVEEEERNPADEFGLSNPPEEGEEEPQPNEGGEEEEDNLDLTPEEMGLENPPE